jgi:hypothetical protein
VPQSTPAPFQPTVSQINPSANVPLIPSTGGQASVFSAGASLTLPTDPSRPDLRLEVNPLRTGGLPPAPSGGFLIGDSAFEINAFNVRTGGAIHEFAVPLTLSYRPTASELAFVGGDLNRIRVALFNGTGWVPLLCQNDGTGGINCQVPHLTQFAVIIAPPDVRNVAYAIPNGFFYKQANGFGGAGDVGFSVTDEGGARFYEQFLGYGGVETLGYPISHRFVHKGFLTQAFQKIALQWRPELGYAVPVNVMDDLHEYGADAFLDANRQIPLPDDNLGDRGLTFEQVVQRHVGFLNAYPDLQEFYLGTNDWLNVYGLPVSVKNYGAFITVRTQRATLQRWNVDMPWAAAGQIVVGNGADVAKEAGLWPITALAPSLP